MLRTLPLALLLVIAAPALAQAKTAHLHGIVLAVTPANGQVVVRHDAFAGMPSMVMPFRVLPRARAAQLLPGNEIDADVDTSTDPWTLSHVSTTTTDVVAPPATPHAAPLHVGDIVPDTPFVDQNGRPFRFSMLRGRDVVLGFIYTRCRDPRMCPLISAHFNQLQRAVGTRNARLVEVTLDPSYDRPSVLARYGRMFGADPRLWTLAVGDAQPTLDFSARFGIAVFPDPVAGLIHTENLVEIGPDGRIEKMIPDAAWQPADILADLDGSRSADAPFTSLDWTAAALVLLAAVAAGYLAFRIGRRVFTRTA